MTIDRTLADAVRESSRRFSDAVAITRERRAPHTCPTSAEMVDAMLRNPSGLVLKQEPRAPWWAGNERNIG